MNLPDKEKLIGRTSYVNRSEILKFLSVYETAIKPEIEQLEAKIAQLEAENNRLREALKPFAHIGKLIKMHKHNLTPIRDCDLIKAAEVLGGE